MRRMKGFERATPVVDFPAAEARIREFWREQHIFERSLEKRREGPRFVFYEGPPPPTACRTTATR